MERTITPPDITNAKPPAAVNFASAFKSKDIKNASSWSSLAQASSPQNSNFANSSRSTLDSFQAFKKQAKQQADRVSAAHIRLCIKICQVPVMTKSSH